MTIRWHRTEMKNDEGVPYTVYYSHDKDWLAWTIDQEHCSNGSRTYWSEWQPKYLGTTAGLRHFRLRDAKAYVESEGREVSPETS